MLVLAKKPIRVAFWLAQPITYLCEWVRKRVFKLGLHFDGQLVFDGFDAVRKIDYLLDVHVGPKLIDHIVHPFEHHSRLIVMRLFDKLSSNANNSCGWSL